MNIPDWVIASLWTLAVILVGMPVIAVAIGAASRVRWRWKDRHVQELVVQSALLQARIDTLKDQISWLERGQHKELENLKQLHAKIEVEQQKLQVIQSQREQLEGHVKEHIQ